jgi:propanol-preferring alcohol dehydrogenase
MTPGHQAVGTVVAQGSDCDSTNLGKRVGVAWIHSACGICVPCQSGLENLCQQFMASGRDRPGGYAEYMTAPEAYVHRIPDALASQQAAPLLCAGAVGYRALSLTGLRDGESLGLTGFGASGHLVLQMARFLFPRSPIYVFARSAVERDFALALGANWVGETSEHPPKTLDAVIDTTPAWLPVVRALDALAPGGRLIINALRKEESDRAELQQLDYERHLWMEKSIKSVANVTRGDVRNALELAVRIPLVPRITMYPLEQAVSALMSIKSGHIEGAAVLCLDDPDGSNAGSAIHD